MRIIKNSVKYIIENIEYVLVVFMLAGIITFNLIFENIRIGQVYLIWLIIILCFLSWATKLIVSVNPLNKSKFKDLFNNLFMRTWPLAVIFLYAIVRLIYDLDYGFQAVQHSLMSLYILLFMLLFIFSIKTEKQLFFIILFLLIILSSVFIGSKIILFKFLNQSFNYYEPLRVSHIETDTICASIALLGLLVYHNLFWNKSKIGFLMLVLLNITILFFTVKRSAVLCIIPSVIIYFFLVKHKLNKKKIVLFLAASVLTVIIFLTFWYLANSESFNYYSTYFFEKLSFNEKNASWRLKIWNISWNEFIKNPLFGIGYGQQIIDTPVDGVEANDPHNSFLAFLTRNGLLVFIVYLFFIGKTFLIIFRKIRNSKENVLNYCNTIFICLCLISMIIFSLFNVVFENLYVGIFFNFFLSAVYINEIPKIEIISARPNKIVNYLSVLILTLVFLFVLYSFSPLNQIRKLSIYSAKTNFWKPVIEKTQFSRTVITSDKDTGISITTNNDDDRAFLDLLWIIPSQSNNLKLNKCEIIIESNGCIKNADFLIQFEDNTRKKLPGNCTGTITKIKLNSLYQNNSQEISRIRFFVLAFPHYSNVNNLIIRNIYIKPN